MKKAEINESKRIESEQEVSTYIDRLLYALKDKNFQILFQQDRYVDKDRNIRFTNRFTMQELFPDNNPIKVLRRELAGLTIRDYIETVKDIKFDSRSEMRVFGKSYTGRDVYIKIRVELLSSNYGNGNILVMSFHFSTSSFSKNSFPYKTRGKE